MTEYHATDKFGNHARCWPRPEHGHWNYSTSNKDGRDTKADWAPTLKTAKKFAKEDLDRRNHWVIRQRMRWVPVEIGIAGVTAPLPVANPQEKR